MQNWVKTSLIVLLTAASASLSAAPYGYSINSDSGSTTGQQDGLYRIDLADGTETRIGTVQSLLQTKLDVEGLAFAPDGTLYGIDDETLKLFPINTDNAVADHTNEVKLDQLSAGVNDFGMTFACDGNLYATSVATKSLYQIDPLTGTTTLIGSLGDPNLKISAIAAYGNPIELYGLGNGLKVLPDDSFVADTPNLYSINPGTGQATVIGPLGGTEVERYLEAGLAFDDSGDLWAITDRRKLNLPSQVMKLDLTNSGKAVNISETKEQGFESLAITVPRGCQTKPDLNEPHVDFLVQKQFLDYNENTPVTLNISCTDGHYGPESITVMPNQGVFGRYEVSFPVSSFTDGNLNCDITETVPDNYTPSYQCFSEGECTDSRDKVESVEGAETEDKCTFKNVEYNQANLCVIRNYPDPVKVTVAAEWFYGSEDLPTNHHVNVDLQCRNVLDGDGDWANSKLMTWTFNFTHDTADQVATVTPASPLSECRTVVHARSTAIESTGSCEEWTEVHRSDKTLTCTVYNTVFFEGIPTLNQYGLILISALMLLTGMVAARRF